MTDDKLSEIASQETMRSLAQTIADQAIQIAQLRGQCAAQQQQIAGLKRPAPDQPNPQ